MSISVVLLILCQRRAALTTQDVFTASYVRTVNRTDGVSVSQTESKKLSAPGLPDVWLIGAAHIGSKEFYAHLQTLLNAQSIVLYEGVRSKNNPTTPKFDPKGPKPVYQVISDAVGLDFQLVDIDYSNPNWINSDLSMTDLEKLNKEGGRGNATGFSAIEKMLDPNSEQTKMMASFFATASPSIKEAMKIFLLDKLSKAEVMLPSMTDSTTLNVLLTARNKSVETTFEKLLAASPQPKSVGIFYGAAHLSGIEKVLRDKYNYKPVEQQWFTFAKADHKKLDADGKQFLATLESMATQALGGSK